MANKPLDRPQLLDYEELVDRVPGVVGVHNVLTGEYVYINRAVNKLLGYTPKEFRSGGIKFAGSLVHPDDLSKIMAENKRAITKANKARPNSSNKESVVSFEYRMRHKDGHWVWLRTDCSVYSRTKNGRVEQVLYISVDITERKKSEETLHKASQKTRNALDASQQKYQAFIRNSSEGIWRFELEKPISIKLKPAEQIRLMYERAYLAEANQAVANMYGAKSVKSLLGMRLGKFLIPDNPANIEYLTAFIKSGYSLSGVESREKDQRGNDKYFRNSLVGEVENGHVVRAWGTQQDTTEQRLATKALKHSQTGLALALKASQMGMWEWKISTNELTWSDELKRIFGLKPKDKVSFDKYQSIIHPDDREFTRKHIEKAMRDGKVYSFEHRIIWPDGSEHWIQGQGQAIFKDGKAVKMLGTSMNIDKRKHDEARFLESQERKRKLEVKAAILTRQHSELVALNKAKDDFISLASHQLRTPATGVKQYIGMLLEGYGGKLIKKQLSILKTAYESNERQLKIVGDLLKVAHVDANRVIINRQKCDLIPIIKDVIQEQKSALAKRKQSIAYDAPKKPVAAFVDPYRIRMVIENVLDNASKYTAKSKKITIQLKEFKRHVNIKIADEGVGIAQKDIPKLFYKFSRIENKFSATAGGTGLGLYWAKKIMDLHGGTIQVKSVVDKGTSFIIKIPKGAA